MTPKAASQGANTTKAAAVAAPQVTGIESRTLPLSSFITILLTLASFNISSLFLSARPLTHGKYPYRRLLACRNLDRILRH